MVLMANTPGSALPELALRFDGDDPHSVAAVQAALRRWSRGNDQRS